jgi:hypothetical protein
MSANIYDQYLCTCLVFFGFQIWHRMDVTCRSLSLALALPLCLFLFLSPFALPLFLSLVLRTGQALDRLAASRAIVFSAGC